MIHVGIDLHSRNMTLVAVNDNGELIYEVKTKSNPANLERFFNRFDDSVQAAVECTSYWYWVVDWCRTQEITLQLAHAKMLKAISYAKVKTDSVDTRTLADLLRAGCQLDDSCRGWGYRPVPHQQAIYQLLPVGSGEQGLRWEPSASQ